MITTRWLPEPRPYTGPELRPHYILSSTRIEGSALIAFAGPCHVVTDHLVDWEDRLANDHIQAKQMLHFLGEFFGLGLREGVWLQRLFVAQLAEELLARGVSVRRDGDDLFVGDRKMSVSIVTASAVSILLHTGVNIDPAGAPVPAVGLAELGIDPASFAQAALCRFETEWHSIHRATTKVRPV